MMTRKEISVHLGIRLTTLNSRLWETAFPPSGIKVIRGNLVYQYNKVAVEKIEDLFKGRIPGKVGRPKLKKDKKP